MSLAGFGGSFLESFNKSYGAEQDKKTKLAAEEKSNQIKALEGLFKDENTADASRPTILRQVLKLHGLKDDKIEEIVGHHDTTAKSMGISAKPAPAGQPVSPASPVPSVSSALSPEGPESGSGEGVTPETPMPTIGSSTSTAVARPQMPAYQPLEESFGNRNAATNKLGRNAQIQGQAALDKEYEDLRLKQAMKTAEEDGTFANAERRLDRPLKDAEKTAIVMKQAGVAQTSTARSYRPPMNGNQIPVADPETGEEIKDSFGQAIKRDGSTQYRLVPDATGAMGFQPMDALPAKESVKIEKVAGPNGTQVLAKVNKTGDILGFVNVNGHPVSPPVRMQAVTVTDPDSGQQYTKFVNPYTGGGAGMETAPASISPNTPLPTRQAPAQAQPQSSAPTFSTVDFASLKPGQTISGDDGKQYTFKGVKNNHAVIVPAGGKVTPNSPQPNDPDAIRGALLLKTNPKAVAPDIRQRIEAVDKYLPMINEVEKKIKAAAAKDKKGGVLGQTLGAVRGEMNKHMYNGIPGIIGGQDPEDPLRSEVLQPLSLVSTGLTANYMNGSKAVQMVNLIKQHLPQGNESWSLMLNKIHKLQEQLPRFRNEELKAAGMRTLGGKVLESVSQEEE